MPGHVGNCMWPPTRRSCSACSIATTWPSTMIATPHAGRGEPHRRDDAPRPSAHWRAIPMVNVLIGEGPRINMANHSGNAFRGDDETIAMSQAVQAAIDATSADDTLIIVTADHFAHPQLPPRLPGARQPDPRQGRVAGTASTAPPATWRRTAPGMALNTTLGSRQRSRLHRRRSDSAARRRQVLSAQDQGLPAVAPDGREPPNPRRYRRPPMTCKD